MTKPSPASSGPAPGPKFTARRIGCVSFLNAKPLIEGLNDQDRFNELEVKYDVPSRLLADLDDGRVDIALCPVIDYYRSRNRLRIVPSGGIGCDGPTLTVLLCSRTPVERIERIHADTDSHTSVILVQVVLALRYGVRPTIVPHDANQPVTDSRKREQPESVLMIGDKVVTKAPPREAYPFQIDLGQAWKTMTGLPFVFAVWMARLEVDLGDLPARLDGQRRCNQRRLEAIAIRHAAAHGWPRDLAVRYFGSLLRYEITPLQIKAMAHFAKLAHGLGLIEELQPLRLG